MLFCFWIKIFENKEKCKKNDKNINKILNIIHSFIPFVEGMNVVKTKSFERLKWFYRRIFTKKTLLEI